jgi:hypothetical protein
MMCKDQCDERKRKLVNRTENEEENGGDVMTK